MCVSYRLICQCVIRVSCYENYTRNTQTALVCTLLPVSYMLRCACWTLVCTKLCRRGQDVEHHRRARCDGSSAPCSGGPQISPHSCAAGAEPEAERSLPSDDFSRFGEAPCPSRVSQRSLRTGRGSSVRPGAHQARIVPCGAPFVGIRTAGNRPMSTKWRHAASGRARLHTPPDSLGARRWDHAPGQYGASSSSSYEPWLA